MSTTDRHEARTREAFIQFAAAWTSGPQLIIRLGTWSGNWWKVGRYEDGSRSVRFGPLEIGIWN